MICYFDFGKAVCAHLYFLQTNNKYLILSLAEITVTVDGGTSRWVTCLKEQGIDILNGNHPEYVPNLITGDMDSSSPKLIEKLHDLGAKVKNTPDQNHTDYTKALVELDRWTKIHGITVMSYILYSDD